MLDENVVSLRHFREDIAMDEFTENGEFVIESTTTLKKDKLQLRTANVKALVFRLVLRRRAMYHIVNLVIPVALLQALGVLAFKIPASCGEKLTFSLTMLLTVTVLMTMVSAIIPTTSLQVSIFSIYLLCGAVASALEVVITVVVLYLHSHGDKQLPAFACFSKQSKVMCSTSISPSLDNTCTTVESLDGCEFLMGQHINPSSKSLKNTEDTKSLNDCEMTGNLKDKTILIINENVISCSNNVNNKQNEFSPKSRTGRTYEEFAKNIDNVCFILFMIVLPCYSFACLFIVVL
ncbi:hypothetical protein DPMN_124762 [Dreissena polymorpha]|uniref:Neurotransmitter-gated ion-channel transmembrane domain-containing protein n=2 Tax=Dreissena polymorpha TaxID=45954 RepID=A0A9D4GU06_DREPO|nr:hypothetical protein DPMN_124762 [Dreissena polymorpha]